MTAKDVVASMKQYVSAKGSNAGLSPFFDAGGRLGDRARTRCSSS